MSCPYISAENQPCPINGGAYYQPAPGEAPHRTGQGYWTVKVIVYVVAASVTDTALMS